MQTDIEDHEISIEFGSHYLEDVQARFNVTKEYIEAQKLAPEDWYTQPGYWEVSVELIDIKVGGLTLNRYQIEEAAGRLEIERVEYYKAEEIAEMEE